MPASRFTKKANTPKRKRQWEHVYESAKSRGASEGSAIAQASGVVKKDRGGRHDRRKSKRTKRAGSKRR